MTPPGKTSPIDRFRRYGLWVLAAVVTAVIWWQGREDLDPNRSYRIGIGGDVPMHYFDATGQPTGLAVQIVQAAADRQGVKVEWQDAKELEGGNLDMWVLKSVIPERSVGLHLTQPYLQAESCFLVRADSPIRDVPDLRGCRVSYVDYLVHRVTLPQLLDEFEPLPRDSSQAVIDALRQGEADAAYIDQYTLFATLLRGEGGPLRILPTRSPTRDMALAARPDAAAAADRIRDGMRLLAEEGSLDELVRHWIFFPNITANIVGDIARERRQIRWLLAGLGMLGVFSLACLTLFAVAQRRKKELRRSERNYRVLHESMSDAFVRFDTNHCITEVNRAFCDLLRREPRELLGRQHASLSPSVWHETEARIHREQVLVRGSSDVYEKEYLRSDGQLLPVELRVFLLRATTGRPKGHWAIVRDISERKLAERERERLQQQLTQSQKLEVVGQLAGGVAHDYNNMLQAILGNASLALVELPADHPVREYVDEIQASANRSAALTRQLLTFARRQPTAPQVLDLNLTVSGILKLLRRLIGENVDLRWEPADITWPVRIDPHQADQILTNLCVNARDALPDEGGRIVIATRNVRRDDTPPNFPQGEYVALSVTDNGHGIDADTQPHLFEPFFTTKPAGQGTGLGLATVYGILQQNRGFITVDSAPGAGATFTVFLPRHIDAAPDPTPATPIVDCDPRGTETILLVEDEDAVRRVASRLLTSLGYRLIEASSAEEAIRLAEKWREPIDLLLADVVMPGASGPELAATLVARRPGLRCLFMSGYTEGRIADAHHFVAKPFTANALSQAVRRALDDPLAAEHA